MGEQVYGMSTSLLGEWCDVDIRFSDGDDEWACLCTFPVNDGGELTAERVRSLALLGAAIALVHGSSEDLVLSSGFFGPTVMLPDAVPEWIRQGIKRLVREEE